MRVSVFLFLLIMMVELIYPHPVIWKGGQVINSVFKENQLHLNYHYSLTNKHAIGIHYLSNDSNSYAMFQSNYLLKRWNKRHSQANIYVKTGLGIETDDSQNGLFHLGIQADWETLYYYTQLQFDTFQTRNSFTMGNFRVGFSPYQAEYDEIQTWLILQLDYNSLNPGKLIPIPMIRVFKQNFLIEFGYDFIDNYLVTIMYHF